MIKTKTKSLLVVAIACVLAVSLCFGLASLSTKNSASAATEVKFTFNDETPGATTSSDWAISSSDVTYSFTNVSTDAGGKTFATTDGNMLVATLNSGSSYLYLETAEQYNVSSISLSAQTSDRGKSYIAVSYSADKQSWTTLVEAMTFTDAGVGSNAKWATLDLSSKISTAVSGYIRFEFTNNPSSSNKAIALDNITLTTVESYTVTYMNGSEQFAQKSVAEGNLAEDIEFDAGDGQTFTGWYADAECSELFDFDTAITQDTILYAGIVDTSSLIEIVDILTADISETVVFGSVYALPAIVSGVDAGSITYDDIEVIWEDEDGNKVDDVDTSVVGTFTFTGYISSSLYRGDDTIRATIEIYKEPVFAHEVVLFNGTAIEQGVELMEAKTGLTYKFGIGLAFESKTYKTGGSTQPDKNRQIEIVIPAGYVADITVNMKTGSNGDPRSAFIATQVSQNTSDAIDSVLITSDSNDAEGTVYSLASGTYYVCAGASIKYNSIKVKLYSEKYLIGYANADGTLGLRTSENSANAVYAKDVAAAGTSIRVGETKAVRFGFSITGQNIDKLSKETILNALSATITVSAESSKNVQISSYLIEENKITFYATMVNFDDEYNQVKVSSSAVASFNGVDLGSATNTAYSAYEVAEEYADIIGADCAALYGYVAQ